MNTLSYSRWVYISKTSMKKPMDLLKNLEEEAINSSNCLSCYAKKYLCESRILCFFIRIKNENYETILYALLNFAIHNQKTLQKICEHMDTVYKTNMFSTWLQQKYKKFKFNQSDILTRLELESKTLIEQECPICFEEIGKDKPCIILKCGHISCIECLQKLYGIDEIKGTLYNKIRYRETYSPMMCPTCRYVNPCGKLDDINIFPKNQRSILYN